MNENKDMLIEQVTNNQYDDAAWEATDMALLEKGILQPEDLR